MAVVALSIGCGNQLRKHFFSSAIFTGACLGSGVGSGVGGLAGFGGPGVGVGGSGVGVGFGLGSGVGSGSGVGVDDGLRNTLNVIIAINWNTAIITSAPRLLNIELVTFIWSAFVFIVVFLSTDEKKYL